jgi:hypothetical protein
MWREKRATLGITFRAKTPYKTWWVSIERDSDEDLSKPVPEGERKTAEAIMAALEGAGWTVERYAEGTAWPMWDASKPGSGLFGGWTPEEAKKYMAEARKILRKFGLTKVPKRRLTLADML